MEFTNLNLITISIFLIILLGIVFLCFNTYKKQIQFNNKFNLLKSNKYFYIKYLLLIMTLLIMLFGIFGVKYGLKKIHNKNEGVDVMFVVDVSKSMNVADIKDDNYLYTRLDIVKNSIVEFVSKHKSDRFGLVIFAGDAVSTIPLTTDHDLFLTILKGVDYRNLTKQGSDFNKALSLGVDRFTSDKDRSKALIFISDGGDPDDTIDKDFIKEISSKTKGITYFVVGVGTNKGGRIITGKDVWGEYSYQKYKGNYVVSKINKNNLNDIASVLNSDIFNINEISDLSNLNNDLNKLDKKVLETDINGGLGNYGRQLTIFAFITFILFLIIYIFEDKFYFLIKKYYVKKN